MTAETSATSADESLYLQRFQAAANAPQETYDTLEPVPGAAGRTLIPAAATATIDAAALDAAETYAQQSNAKAFMVWRDGVLERETYFAGAGRPSLLASKSLAKPLTAVAVGRALALGVIKSLDQSLADFITEWKGTPKADILVRHTLDMRTGFLPQGFSTDPADVLNRAYLHPRHDDILINDYPLVNPPGSRYDYANATSELVALVIERATGRRYAEFISEEVLKPIAAPGGQIWVDRPGGLAHSGCCILLPAESWLRLAILLIDDGVHDGVRLLPEGYVSEMRTGTEQNPHYGLGVYIGAPYAERRGWAAPDTPWPKILHSEPYAAEDLYLFCGNSNQVVYVVPSKRLIVLRVGDNPPKTPEWDNSVLPNLILKGL
ncbi:serine hydrolase domain-containing protein [Caulobacter hibisci]|uniref:Serine hydrolase n=1 Tax=Caulobacter hibisci TaxID=2035993 RepID=A0ABS0SWE5_9CAUL|nr:serine hydrolase [Caulobacter hibisci]MBI1682972.1 serine hydrolase [Caulobacter hibisci]